MAPTKTSRGSSPLRMLLLLPILIHFCEGTSASVQEQSRTTGCDATSASCLATAAPKAHSLLQAKVESKRAAKKPKVPKGHSLLQSKFSSSKRVAYNASRVTGEEPEQAPTLLTASAWGGSEGCEWSALQATASAAAIRCKIDHDCGWHGYCAGERCKTYDLGAVPAVDVTVGAVSFVVAAVSLAAGVGGGGLFVPLLMSGASFDARTATALSQAMLFGGAAAAFLYNIRQSHPSDPKRHLVDFELACLLGSALMSGGQLGSVIHNVAPSALLLALLVFVLADSARKSARSAFKMVASEDKQALKQHREEEKKDSEEEPAAEPARRDSYPQVAQPWPAPEGTTGETTEYFIGDEPKGWLSSLPSIPSGAGWLVVVWVFTLCVDVAKGLHLDLCSPAWWCATGGAVALLGGFSLHFARTLSQRETAGPDDVDFKNLAFPLARCGFLAGVLAAICGIGGGMVVGPVLVELNVPPKVSAATTATTLLVLSSSTGLVYWCRGMAPLDYSLAMSAVTMCGAMTGKIVIGWWIEKTGRQSVIVWCLLLITVLSASLMGLLGLLRVVETGWHAFHFKNFCAMASTAVAVKV